MDYKPRRGLGFAQGGAKRGGMKPLDPAQPGGRMSKLKPAPRVVPGKAVPLSDDDEDYTPPGTTPPDDGSRWNPESQRVEPDDGGEGDDPFDPAHPSRDGGESDGGDYGEPPQWIKDIKDPQERMRQWELYKRRMTEGSYGDGGEGPDDNTRFRRRNGNR